MSLLRVLSLGAGVQSSTSALRHATGVDAPIDAAIFADTQEEPAAVYAWLDYLETAVKAAPHPFPIYRVTRGKLWDSATRVRTTKDGLRTYIQTAVPVFMLDGLKKGMGQRHCTKDFKVDVVERQVRKLLGIKRITKSHGVLVEMLIGISTDEADRMKPARRPWIKTSWPLIDANMSRTDCLIWMATHGYPTPPRSACIACPFHSDAEWLALSPSEFQTACEQEKQLQRAYSQASALKATPFLHASRVPLSEVKFKQDEVSPLNKFRNDCEGLCGV